MNNAVVIKDIPTDENLIEFLDAMEKHRIKTTDVIPPPEYAIQVLDEDNPEKIGIIGTLGNFTVLTGKAKSKKTFFTAILTASLISEKSILRTFNGCLPPDQRNVLYFDTEQSKWHVQKALKRICKLSGNINPAELIVYGLRSEKTENRLEFIKHKIYETENLGAVIIDGVRDIAFDINDSKEASDVAGYLLKWTEEKHIFLMTILHQNKGDNNARGHLGTELINKAETVLSVERINNSEISVVTPTQTRNREPDPFAFAVDNDGIPYKQRVPQTADKRTPKFSIDDVELSIIWELIQTIFAETKVTVPLVDGIFRKEIKKIGKGFFAEKESLNDADVNSILLIAKANEMIIQEKKRHPFKLGSFS